MDINLFLELFRVQRHDFLNHLQVISGYLQLNKVSRAKEYIQEVVLGFDRLKEVINLKVPEAVAIFLTGQNEARQYEINVEYDIKSDLASPVLSGSDLGRCLKMALNQAISCMVSSKNDNRQLKISLFKEGNNYVFYICFYCKDQMADIKENVKDINNFLSFYNGKAEFKLDNGQGKILLYLPVKGEVSVL